MTAWLWRTLAISEPFEQCIKERERGNAYVGLYESAVTLVHFLAWADLRSACAVHIANKYNGALTAASGIAVAIFTATLWRVTWGMSKLAEQQRLDLIDGLEITRSQADIADRQTRIFEKQLRARLPNVVFSEHVMALRWHGKKSDEIDCCMLWLRLVNRGETIAYNVNYWMSDPIFFDWNSESDSERFARDRAVVDDLYLGDGQPGHTILGPAEFFDTDQRRLVQSDFNALSEQRKRMYVWCVVRCGSRLEEPTWFAETAIYLEFVWQMNERTAFGAKTTGPADYFRVRTAGHRYREGHDPS